MTQPAPNAARPDMLTAIGNHYSQQAASTENEIPSWWNEENQEDIARMVADPAYRAEMSPYRRRFLSSVREAAIERGFIGAADYVPGFTGYPAGDEAGEHGYGGTAA